MNPGDRIIVRDGPFSIPARVAEVDGELIRVRFVNEPMRWFHRGNVRLQEAVGNKAFHRPDDGEDSAA